MSAKVFTNAFNGRRGLVYLLASLLIIISMLTRIALLIKSHTYVDFTFVNLAGIFLLGLFYDVVNAVYYSIPLVLYLWLVSDNIFKNSWHGIALYVIFFIVTFLLLFNAVAEWFFWDEFSTRFNFIAVDYLVYTTEVIGNISQSYPLELILSVLFVAAVAIVYFISPLIRASAIQPSTLLQRTKLVLIYAFFPMLAFFVVSNKIHQFSNNAYVNELAGNGIYELFAAYRNNELNYEQFYKRTDIKETFATMHRLIHTKESEFISNDPASIERKITNNGPEQKLNVVLICVESFSADFMGKFGNENKITPFLDSIAEHGILFTNLYATGTRTVRGLEALSLCVPPTPGQSIVRRPHDEDLFSLGRVFTDKGYESKYIYGGYGYFDNMGYFFSHNNYTVVDRDNLNDSEIDYENIWGVADENLFTLSMKEIDKSTSKGKPVFTHIMTTSNHRPFTYPDGRIDIPSHTGRDGAVKYTDYAIGKFIKEARGKTWFENTIFIIVADHCASSAGKTELPVNKYHIPMIMYSPSHIKPAIMDRLMSQIDIGPTLLGMLNFTYDSKFYGYDMYKLEPGRERAFISTYQSLGFIKDHTLVVLSPHQKVESFSIVAGEDNKKVNPDEKVINEAIAWYETSSYGFTNGLMNSHNNTHQN